MQNNVCSSSHPSAIVQEDLSPGRDISLAAHGGSAEWPQISLQRRRRLGRQICGDAMLATYYCWMGKNPRPLVMEGAYLEMSHG